MDLFSPIIFGSYETVEWAVDTREIDIHELNDEGQTLLTCIPFLSQMSIY